MVEEVGSGMNDSRRKLNRLLADPTVGTIIVEHRDRLARMNAGLVESALKAAGRRLVVVDDSELDDDLVCDMTEVLTSFCARLYGRRSAKNKAKAKAEQAKTQARIAAGTRDWVPWVFIPVGLLGVLWLLVFYVAGNQVPVFRDLQSWNYLIGIGLIASSFVIATFWK